MDVFEPGPVGGGFVWGLANPELFGRFGWARRVVGQHVAHVAVFVAGEALNDVGRAAGVGRCCGADVSEVVAGGERERVGRTGGVSGGRGPGGFVGVGRQVAESARPTSLSYARRLRPDVVAVGGRSGSVISLRASKAPSVRGRCRIQQQKGRKRRPKRQAIRAQPDLLSVKDRLANWR